MDRQDVKRKIEEILSEMIGLSSVNETDTINKKIGLIGLESEEFFLKIHKIFGTDFTDMQPERFFKETSFFLFPLRKSKAKDLTIGHLLDVIQKGKWYDPPRG